MTAQPSQFMAEALVIDVVRYVAQALRLRGRDWVTDREVAQAIQRGRANGKMPDRRRLQAVLKAALQFQLLEERHEHTVTETRKEAIRSTTWFVRLAEGAEGRIAAVQNAVTQVRTATESPPGGRPNPTAFSALPIRARSAGTVPVKIRNGATVTDAGSVPVLTVGKDDVERTDGGSTVEDRVAQCVAFIRRRSQDAGAPVRLTLKAIAKATGMSEKSARTALTRAIKRKLVRRLKDGKCKRRHLFRLENWPKPSTRRRSALGRVPGTLRGQP